MSGGIRTTFMGQLSPREACSQRAGQDMMRGGGAGGEQGVRWVFDGVSG